MQGHLTFIHVSMRKTCYEIIKTVIEMHETEGALQSLFEIRVLYCFSVINAIKKLNLLFNLSYRLLRHRCKEWKQ